MSRDFRKIIAWQHARKLNEIVYSITALFPKQETYGLISQIRRATISVAANIAEGSSRQHRKDYLNFLFIAKASLSELQCLMILAADLRMISPDQQELFEPIFQETAKSLFGLINAVQSDIQGLKSRVSSLES